ncbi:hypothetical protein ACFLYL_01105 [Chloroflexota bacterium]
MNETKPQGLDLAFNWVRNVLDDQERNAEIYNNRMILLFSAATAILGIGFPLGLEGISEVFVTPWTMVSWFLVVCMTSYLLSIITIAIGIWPQSFIKLDDPIKIREDFWDLQEDEFKVQILAHTEDAYTKNREQLNWKAWAIYILILLLPIETISLTLAFTLAPR